MQAYVALNFFDREVLSLPLELGLRAVHILCTGREGLL